MYCLKSVMRIKNTNDISDEWLGNHEPIISHCNGIREPSRRHYMHIHGFPKPISISRVKAFTLQDSSLVYIVFKFN